MGQFFNNEYYDTADLDTSISSIDIFYMNQGDSLLLLDKDRIF